MARSRLGRALVALPMLALTGIMVRTTILMTPPLTPEIDKFYNQSSFDTQAGASIPIRREFYGIPAVDFLLSRTTITFCYFIFQDGAALYWQSFVFLVDLAVMYVIMVLESYRRANRGTFCQTSLVTVLAGQILGLGNVSPIHHFLLYVASPVEKLATAEARLIDGAAAISILPALIPAYLVPVFVSFLHPNMEVRLWWNWLWQLFPLYVSLAILVLSRQATWTGLLDVGLQAVQERNRAVIRLTLGVLCSLATIVSWYARLCSGFSIREMFVPAYFLELPNSAGDAIKAFMQYDYMVCLGSQLLWMALSIGDLKAEGLCKEVSWTRIGLVALAVCVVGSPGTMLAVGWMMREEMMAGYEKAKQS